MDEKPLKPTTILKRKARLIQHIRKLEQDIKNIEKRCSHDWQYESDPSGNNDTGWFCRACNTWRRRL